MLSQVVRSAGQPTCPNETFHAGEAIGPPSAVFLVIHGLRAILLHVDNSNQDLAKLSIFAFMNCELCDKNEPLRAFELDSGWILICSDCDPRSLFCFW
jgi:hypothetical protein